MSKPTPSFWQRKKFHLNALVLIAPMYFLYHALNPTVDEELASMFEQKTLSTTRTLNADNDTETASVLTAHPVPLSHRPAYLHDGIYVKDFRVDFCDDCIPTIRQAYLNAGPAPAEFPEEPDGILHGNRFALHVHAPFPHTPTAEDRLWLSVETWAGELQQTSWPLIHNK